MQAKAQHQLFNLVFPYFQLLPQHNGDFFYLFASAMEAFFLPETEGKTKHMNSFIPYKPTK